MDVTPTETGTETTKRSQSRSSTDASLRKEERPASVEGDDGHKQEASLEREKEKERKRGKEEEPARLGTASTVGRNDEKAALARADAGGEEGDEKAEAAAAAAAGEEEEDKIEYLPPARLALLTVGLALCIFVVRPSFSHVGALPAGL